MPIQTYRYGEARDLPGLSIGVTRHPPRGVRREAYGVRGYGSVWMPMLGPSAALLAEFRQGKITFAILARRYRREMKEPAPRQVIELLAALSREQPINLGCYCEDPKHCHRTILAELVQEAAAALPDTGSRPAVGYASPACSMPEIED